MYERINVSVFKGTLERGGDQFTSLASQTQTLNKLSNRYNLVIVNMNLLHSEKRITDDEYATITQALDINMQVLYRNLSNYWTLARTWDQIEKPVTTAMEKVNTHMLNACHLIALESA